MLTNAKNNAIDFSYDIVKVNDLVANTVENPSTGRREVTSVSINGDTYQNSTRFFTSLCSRFGINSACFKYFSYDEVFERIAQVEKNDRMRICMEHSSGGAKRLLAVSNPEKPVVQASDLVNLIQEYGGENISYCDGVVESVHSPRIGGESFSVSGDAYNNRYVVATPIDGYGKPSTYLSLLRQICENGVIGYAKAFRQQISIGRGEDNIAFSLTRVFDQFNCDEGYAALRQRLETAAMSWASVKEAVVLYKTLATLYNAKAVSTGGNSLAAAPYLDKLVTESDKTPGLNLEEASRKSKLLSAFHTMTGDIQSLYGLANPDSLSEKRQSALPVDCRVMDLLIFASEVATHCVQNVEHSRKMQGFVGTLLSSDYDLENTCTSYTDFKDFHIASKGNLQLSA